MQTLSKPDFETLSASFPHWQKIGDLIDQCIDLMLNLRQSGHPGGSRSKVPLLVASTLGAGMRFDLRHPEHPFGDRFVLVAGHCNPAVYDPAGSVDVDPSLRSAFRPALASSIAFVVGCALALAATGWARRRERRAVP